MIHARPGKPLSAAELNELGRTATSSRPGRVEGMGGAGVGSGLSAGVGGAFPQPDVERFYLVEITGSDADGYLFQEKYSATGDDVYTDDPSGINSGGGWRVVSPSGAGLDVGTLVLVRKHKTNPALYEVVSAAGGGGLSVLVPILKLEIAPPASGCDDLDDCVRQCWGPWYIAKVLSRSADDCGAWVCGECVYLTVVEGLPIPIGHPIPGWILGSVPASVSAFALPGDLDCGEGELDAAPLYGATASHLTYAAVPDTAAGWCPDDETAGYIQAYTCALQVWLDCSGWTNVGTGYMADVNGCSSPANVRQVVSFSRMVSGDEFDAEGEPRACSPLFVYKRGKNFNYRFETAGGRLTVYGPDAGPCGDTETLLQDLPCCTEGGDGGGTGGTGCCEGSDWGPWVTASVLGVGFVFLDWIDDSDVYLGSFTHPGCGRAAWLKFDPATCILSYSCNPAGPWIGLVQPFTFAVICNTAPTPNSAGPYDNLALANPGAGSGAGCDTNSCTAINGIYIGGYLAP